MNEAVRAKISNLIKNNKKKIQYNRIHIKTDCRRIIFESNEDMIIVYKKKCQIENTF